MGEQISAILEGIRFQHLYSWYELLQLLGDDSGYDYGFVEHPHASSADDVTLHPKPGFGKPSKFVQIKWHVNHSNAYSFDSIVEVISGARSLLQKLFDSWKKLKANAQGQSIEIWLVSNWSAVPAPDLGQFIKGQNGTISKEFLNCASKKAAQPREKWKQHLEADDNQLNAFCQDLRLRLGFGSITDLEEKVDYCMRCFGLRYGENARAAAIDEVSKWIELGGENKRITKEVLLKAIQRRNLRATSPEEPSVSLWIHGWEKKCYGKYLPTIEIDWTQHFDQPKRRIPDQRIWDEILLPSLTQVREELKTKPVSSYIDFRGKLPLTAILAVGAAFREVGGYSFRAEQTTRGETSLWKSTTRPSDRHFKVVKEHGDCGDDLLIALCITGSAWEDVERLYKNSPSAFNSVIYAEPDNGPGDGSLSSDADVTALAIHAKEMIRNYRRKYSAFHTHLVLYCPAIFSLFLGQRLNALGTIITYERTADGGYQPSVTLHTG